MTERTVRVTIVLLLNATDGILFTYWASPEGDKQYDPAIKQIMQSLKFTK
jgi:hypothetical protein